MERMQVSHPVLKAVLVVGLPVVAAILSAATSPDSTLSPWRPQMVDFSVYLEAGRRVLAGESPYRPSDQLPFLYPPIAAWLAVPLTWLPLWAAQLLWSVANGLMMLQVVRLSGLRGLVASTVASLCILVIVPVTQVFWYGQIGIVLVVLVLQDLLRPGRDSRWRTGIGTALAAALKLTPALFIPLLALTRRRRGAVLSAAAFVLIALVAAVPAWSISVGFWRGLLAGETGLGDSIVYTPNQSILGATMRIGGLSGTVKAVGLGLSALTALLGLVVGVVWWRRGDRRWALAMVGAASLLASPVSWTHHFVWVVPIGILVMTTRTLGPDRVIALIWCLWVAGAPFMHLPMGGDVELTFDVSKKVLAAITAVLGVAMLAASLAVGLRATPTGSQEGAAVRE